MRVLQLPRVISVVKDDLHGLSAFWRHALTANKVTYIRLPPRARYIFTTRSRRVCSTCTTRPFSLSFSLFSASVRRPLKAVIGTFFFRAIAIQAQRQTASRSRALLFCKSRIKVSSGLFPVNEKMKLPMEGKYISLFFLSRSGTMYVCVCK